jgi:hypothetical protein
MPDALYSLEDYFDTLSRSRRWRASRALARRASDFFGLLGDALMEGRRHRRALLSLPD